VLQHSGCLALDLSTWSRLALSNASHGGASLAGHLSCAQKMGLCLFVYKGSLFHVTTWPDTQGSGAPTPRWPPSRLGEHPINHIAVETTSDRCSPTQ